MKKYMNIYCIVCLSLIFSSVVGKEESLALLQYRIDCEVNRILKLKRPWVLPRTDPNEILDVAIIGGGMAGMSVACGLILEGVNHVCIFDESLEGNEGPWNTCASMNYLRSSKFVMGPAMGIPSLSFCNWYQAAYGEEAWHLMDLVPTSCWAEYLLWYKKVLKLPVVNQMKLKKMFPSSYGLKLIFNSHNEEISLIARKVVLATGRTGFGSGSLPCYMDDLPKQFYGHTNERIDKEQLVGKRIVVIGAGASAFDAAAKALESQAESVIMLVRRKEMPTVNKLSKFSFSGIQHGFHLLGDQQRIQIIEEILSSGTPPPKSSVNRICHFENLSIRFDEQIESIEIEDENLMLRTQSANYSCDFLICATGYGVDGAKRLELELFIDKILLWKDRPEKSLKHPQIGLFPYLGPHFQFLERIPGTAPELKHLYCFNYGAFLSHGVVSAEIPSIGIGAKRLVEGIVSDFFNEQYELYLQTIQGYEIPLFKVDECEIFNKAVY